MDSDGFLENVPYYVETPRDEIRQGYVILLMQFENPSKVSLYDEDTITISAVNDVSIALSTERTSYRVLKGSKASSKVPN